MSTVPNGQPPASKSQAGAGGLQTRVVEGHRTEPGVRREPAAAQEAVQGERGDIPGILLGTAPRGAPVEDLQPRNVAGKCKMVIHFDNRQIVDIECDDWFYINAGLLQQQLYNLGEKVRMRQLVEQRKMIDG